jgi:arylsulfatase A-like enzyme
MSPASINRRDFLKLVGVTSLSALGSASLALPEPLRGWLSKDQKPNILVIVFDALSARNMALYGYPRANTPNLERFAKRATVFHQHHAGGNFTSPGTASLLLGVYPWKHRSLQHRAQVLERYSVLNLFSLLPDDYFRFAYTQNPFAFTLLDQFRRHIHLLPEISKLADYNALFSEKYFQNDYYIASEAEVVALQRELHQPASLFLSLLDEWRIRADNARLDLAYRKTYPLGLTNCRAENPGTQCFELEKAVDWTISQAQKTAQPFFGYVHFFPPHAPYNPRADFVGLFDDNLHIPKKPLFPGADYTNNKALMRHRQHYDQSIAHADSEFGRMLDTLEQTGALEDTVIVFTSDHGEMFERGILGHTTPALYETIAHIPLLISLPRQQKRVDVQLPTSAVDVAPTLLDMTGAAIPDDIEGSVLALDGVQPERRNIYVVEAKSAPKRGRLSPASFALLQWPFKLIQYRGYQAIPDSYELFDLASDPEELNNLYSPENPTARMLAAELTQKLKEVQDAE